METMCLLSWGNPPERFDVEHKLLEVHVIGYGQEDWDDTLTRCEPFDRTGHFSLVYLGPDGKQPLHIEHIGRCNVCGRYERPWWKESQRRCSCWTVK